MHIALKSVLIDFTYFFKGMIGLWLSALIVAVALGGSEDQHETYHSRSSGGQLDLVPTEIHSRHQGERVKTTKVYEPFQNEGSDGDYPTDTRNLGSGSLNEFPGSNENAKSTVRKPASSPSLLSNPHSRKTRSDATYLMSHPNPKSYYSRETQRRTGRDYCDYFDVGEEGYAYCCYY